METITKFFNFIQKNVVYILFAFVFIVAFAGFDIFEKMQHSKTDKTKLVLNYKRVNSVLEYKKFCKKGDAQACFLVASYYLDGKIVSPNLKKASKFLLKSCNFKNGKACLFLGKLWLEKRGGHKPNKNRAKKYLKKSCNLGISQACKELQNLK